MYRRVRVVVWDTGSLRGCAAGRAAAQLWSPSACDCVCHVTREQTLPVPVIGAQRKGFRCAPLRRWAGTCADHWGIAVAILNGEKYSLAVFLRAVHPCCRSPLAALVMWIPEAPFFCASRALKGQKKIIMIIHLPPLTARPWCTPSANTDWHRGIMRSRS